eukprot:1147424-Pelagomonas_calceolata.AAC.6
MPHVQALCCDIFRTQSRNLAGHVSYIINPNATHPSTIGIAGLEHGRRDTRLQDEKQTEEEMFSLWIGNGNECSKNLISCCRQLAGVRYSIAQAGDAFKY